MQMEDLGREEYVIKKAIEREYALVRAIKHLNENQDIQGVNSEDLIPRFSGVNSDLLEIYKLLLNNEEAFSMDIQYQNP